MLLNKTKGEGVTAYRRMFINLTNHPSEKWSPSQMTAAREWGVIVELPFPAVEANASTDEVLALASDYLERVRALLRYACDRQARAAVLCQGEFSLTHALVYGIQSMAAAEQREIAVFAACSERRSEDVLQEDGTVKKLSVFDFVQFREYPNFVK